MKIALVSPGGSFLGNFPKAKQFLDGYKDFMSKYNDGFSGPGLGLLILAALTPPEYEVAFIDENVEPVDYDKNFDIVAISMMTRQAKRGFEIAKVFKSKGTHVVLGGIHPTVMYEESSKYADTIIVGEGEYLWPQFLIDFKLGKAKKKYETNEVVDLKDSPIPRYDLLDADKYRMFWVQTSRGCPHSCEFCAGSNIFGSAYRLKSISQVKNEIDFLMKLPRNANSRISFADDNLFVNKKRAKELMHELRPLSIRWNAQADVSIADDIELLDDMRNAGCVAVIIGFESVRKNSLDKLNPHNWKFKKADKYAQSVEIIQGRGIGIHGSFIVGLDQDDESIFNDTIQFVLDTRLYGAQMNILTALPGTRLRDRFEHEGRILNSNWENYTCNDVTIKHPAITTEQFEDGLIEFWKQVYSPDFLMEKAVYFKDIYKKLATEDFQKREVCQK